MSTASPPNQTSEAEQSIDSAWNAALLVDCPSLPRSMEDDVDRWLLKAKPGNTKLVNLSIANLSIFLSNWESAGADRLGWTGTDVQSLLTCPSNLDDQFRLRNDPSDESISPSQAVDSIHYHGETLAYLNKYWGKRDNYFVAKAEVLRNEQGDSNLRRHIALRGVDPNHIDLRDNPSELMNHDVKTLRETLDSIRLDSDGNTAEPIDNYPYQKTVGRYARALRVARKAMEQERDEIGRYFDGLTEAQKAFPDEEEYKETTANSKGRRETELHIKISHLFRLQGALLREFVPKDLRRGRKAAGEGTEHPSSIDA
jgi:hypothetical protein